MPGSNPIRGDIWWVNLGPVVGEEMFKTRPAVIIGSDGVGRLPLRIIVPITEWKSKYEDRIWVIHIFPDDENHLEKEGAVDASQIRSVDIDRFSRKMGVISSHVLDEIAAAVAICVGYK